MNSNPHFKFLKISNEKFEETYSALQKVILNPRLRESRKDFSVEKENHILPQNFQVFMGV